MVLPNKPSHAYYDERFTQDNHVKAYEQRKKRCVIRQTHRLVNGQPTTIGIILAMLTISPDISTSLPIVSG